MLRNIELIFQKGGQHAPESNLQINAEGQMSIAYPLVSGYMYNQVVIEGVGSDGRLVSARFMIGL